MPALNYRLRWPDQSESVCYSPSTSIKDFFQPDVAYPLAEFMQRIRTATQTASDRVQARYGYACSSALDQLLTIEGRAALFSNQPDACVTLLAFGPEL
jgi:uncharacterized repeat protein (TIGR04042 family)